MGTSSCKLLLHFTGWYHLRKSRYDTTSLAAFALKDELSKKENDFTPNSVAKFATDRHNDRRKFVVSTSEYRKLANDSSSTDEQIEKRLEYLEALCRTIIKQELENYVSKKN